MLEALAALKLNPVLRGETIHFGFGEWINTKNGLSQLQQGRDVAELKLAYIRQVVLTQAKARGWAVRVNPQNQNQLTLIKR